MLKKLALAIEQQDRQLQTALQELEKVSHPGNYQSWITKHKAMLEKTKTVIQLLMENSKSDLQS